DSQRRHPDCPRGRPRHQHDSLEGRHTGGVGLRYCDDRGDRQRRHPGRCPPAATLPVPLTNMSAAVPPWPTSCSPPGKTNMASTAPETISLPPLLIVTSPARPPKATTWVPPLSITAVIALPKANTTCLPPFETVVLVARPPPWTI